MKKITFYGKDFTLISKSGVKDHERKEHEPELTLRNKIDDDPDSPTYGALLDQFLREYKIPKKAKNEDEDQDEEPGGNRLYFYADDTKFGKWVGVFRKKIETAKEDFDVTLEIRCRFDMDEKAHFLAAMLLCVEPENLDLKVNISFHQVMDIFLLFIFKNQLAEAAKKGIFRKYQRFENNDSRPHGTIDIARHIRENMGLESGNIAYHYRELTANNPVNCLILAAYKRLREKYPSTCEKHINGEESVYSTLKILQTELGYSKTNVRNIVKENLRPITHPYFSEYEDLRKTCLMILRDEDVSIFDAEDSSEETQSLYMDVTKLWEKFLESRLEKELEGSGLSLTAQGKKPIFAERNDKSIPDLVFRQQNRIAILDAKFKPSWDDFFRGNPSKGKAIGIGADINKCIRDMAVFQAQRTGVIFPYEYKEGESKDAPHRKEEYHKEYHIGFSGDAAPRFDMVRVPVLNVLKKGEKGFEEMGFEEWYRKLEPLVNQALGDYLEVLRKYLNLKETAET